MAPDRLVSQPRPLSPLTLDRDATAQSLWAVEERLACAERELRIQFTRIAQLQAEFDVLLAALRRSDGGPPR